jgi:pimeloyl-ACP methyl ester carboxylesterase
LPRRLRPLEIRIARVVVGPFFASISDLSNDDLYDLLLTSRTTSANGHLSLVRRLRPGHDTPVSGIPTSILLGEVDPLIPPGDLTAIRRQFPDAQVRILPVGHFVHIEDPQTLLGVLDEHST